MDFYLLQKIFGTKYGKKFVNKGITAAKRFNKSKYGKALKKEELKFAKTSGKQILEKTAPAVADLIENAIADKITSVSSNKPEEQTEEIQEEQEIIIPPERRQQIIDELTLF